MHAAAADALTIKAASMANAVVKSSQEMGSLELRLVNSRTRIRKVTQKQKHHVNMHHVQKESVRRATLATRLKVIQLKITSSTRTMPAGVTTALTFSATMTTSACFLQTGAFSFADLLKKLFSFHPIPSNCRCGHRQKVEVRGPSSAITL